MLYTAHFGLRQAPFRATPDPAFFYSNPVYREAYATLLYGVLQRKGFIALTGEVGTGKTTLLRRLMDQLGPPVRFVLFYNTTLNFDETVEFICAELQLAVEGLSRVQRLQRLNDLLIAEARQGGNVVLLIDEAQNLGPDVLENLRLISNLETSTEKLVQIVLAGQPELDAKLAHPALRQLAQRIAVRYRLQPLDDDEVERFIDYRLRRCGSTRRDLFTARAVRRVAAYANGVPRRINILCDAVLLVAYGAGMTRVTGAIVEEVACGLDLPRGRETAAHRLTSAAARGHALRRRGRAAPRARSRRRAAASVAALAAMGAAAALLAGWPLGAVPGDVRAALEAGFGPGASTPTATRSSPLPPAADAKATGGGADAGIAPPALDGATMAAVGALPPPSASPADPPEALSGGHADGWQTIVPGTNISELVWRRHGRHHLLGLDLAKDLNPHIADLDRVSAGQRFWMPDLRLTTLARRQPDGSYRLIVASLTTAEAANRLAERMRHRGYTVRVATRDITSRLQVHRVLVERLADLEAANHTWETAQRLGRTIVDARAR